MTDQERAERLAALQARSGATPPGGPQPAPQGVAGEQRVQSSVRPSPTRKPHAAGGARWVVAGVSAAATVGMIGAMTASAMAAQTAAGPDVVTVVVAEAPAAQTVAAIPGAAAIAAPATNAITSSADPASRALTDTAQAEPSYQVVAKEKPATTKSSGS